MAFEIRPWKKENCSLKIPVNVLSQRETFSQEINSTYGEGGGLNANYQTVDAVAKATSLLAIHGHLEYGQHFIFKTGNYAEIYIDFCDKDTQLLAAEIFNRTVKMFH